MWSHISIFTSFKFDLIYGSRVSKSNFVDLDKMVSSLRVEHWLDGASNFKYWKTRILFILDENEIQDYIKKCLRTRICEGEIQI